MPASTCSRSACCSSILVLAAQYGSWSLPFAVILIVPMCLLAATIGVRIMGQDVNILTQIGFVVLVGLAAKNAILIVEFARDIELEGKPRLEAVIEACRLRLRPILMTSFAFILGVLPLVVSTGSGSEMRQAVGVAVFFGMLGVTLFGLIFTPIFYMMVREPGGCRRSRSLSQSDVDAVSPLCHSGDGASASASGSALAHAGDSSILDVALRCGSMRSRSRR